jgi:hypothetical protein
VGVAAVRLAFWDDVRIDRTLGSGAGLYSANKADKDEPDEKHMHPLQLDVIERAVVLWSNPGETVLTPFMGVGSEVYGAVDERPPRRRRRAEARVLPPGASCTPFADFLAAQDYEMNTPEEAHEILKAKLLTRPVVRPDTGEIIGRIVRSTTELSTEEMTDYIERCRAWLLDFFGIMTNDPLPEDERPRKRVDSRPARGRRGLTGARDGNGGGCVTQNGCN